MLLDFQYSQRCIVGFDKDLLGKVESLGMRASPAATVMHSLDDKLRLADFILELF